MRPEPVTGASKLPLPLMTFCESETYVIIIGVLDRSTLL
jgi:hypothetical protein